MAEAEVDAVLTSTVAEGLLHRVGSAGGTRYVLAGPAGSGAHGGVESRSRTRLLNAIRKQGAIASADAAKALQTTAETARKRLNELVMAGVLRAEGKYRLRRRKANARHPYLTR